MGRGCTTERASETRSRRGIAIELGRDKKKPSEAGLGAVKRGEGADNTIPVKQKNNQGSRILANRGRSRGRGWELTERERNRGNGAIIAWK